MKLKDFIINNTSNILSVFSKNRAFHNYKYCASVQIAPDVTNIIKKHKQQNVQNNHSKVKLFR